MNKKLLKIGSVISILNLTTPIVTNATTYRSIYTTSSGTTSSRIIVIKTTSSTPSSVLLQLRKNKDLGRTTILQSTSSLSNGIEIFQPYTPPKSNKIQYKNIYLPR